MILSDQMLLQAIEAGELRFEPPIDREQQVQPASIDLRLGASFRVFNYGQYALIDPREPIDFNAITDLVTLEDRPFILHPGAFVLGSTLEYVTVPTKLVGRLEGRSSIGRLGVIVHASLPYDAPVCFLNEAGVLGYRPIGELVEHRIQGCVVSFDPETFAIGLHEITNWFRELPDKVYEVRLASGRTVQVTAGHNLFTLDGHGNLVKTPTGALSPGTHVAIPRRIPVPATQPEYQTIALVPNAFRDKLICHGPTIDAVIQRREHEVRRLLREVGIQPTYWLAARKLPYRLLERLHGDTPPLGPHDWIAYKGARSSLPALIRVDEEIAWLIGLYIAEGHRRDKQVTIANTDQQILDRVEVIMRRLGQRLYRAPGAITCLSTLLSEVFRGLAIGSAAATKQLPTGALGWPTPLLASLLRGLLDGDGSISQGRESLWTISRQLVSDILHLAARLGRRAVTQERGPRPRCQPAYVVSIATNEHKLLTSVPLPNALLTQIRAAAGLSQIEASRAIGYAYPTSLSNIEHRQARDAVRLVTLRRIHTAYARNVPGSDQLSPLDKLTRLVEGDLLWDEVAEVVDTGRFETVYDLEVRPEGKHIENFLAGHGGVFVSNTAGFIDPGFEGTITLEISNAGKIPVALHPGMRICQLTLLETGPVARPYGAARRSKYQGQRQPTASRIALDSEFDTPPRQPKQNGTDQ